MLKKILAVALVVALVAALTGCARLYETDNFNGLDLTAEGRTGTHYAASNWGIYFLWYPLLTGNPEKHDSLINVTFLNDTVNLDTVADMVSSAAAGDGYTALEDTGSGYRSITIPFPIPFLCYFRSAAMTTNGI